jgi:CubicO group peptidase (beta-lactamase class C family)
MSTSTPDVDKILSAVPHLRRGVGGVTTVIKDGQLLGKRAWGYADLENRVPMTTKTQFPICSISKQMVCLAMESLRREPTKLMLERKQSSEEQFEAELQNLLPNLPKGHELKVADMYNMQSGIRDYWAMYYKAGFL